MTLASVRVRDLIPGQRLAGRGTITAVTPDAYPGGPWWSWWRVDTDQAAYPWPPDREVYVVET